MKSRLNLRDEKILALANHIGRKKPGSKGAYDFDAPEYLILEPVVTHDMCDVLMPVKILEQVTAEDVSTRCGKSAEECQRLLLELADIGVCVVNNIDGKDTFWYEPWVPGIMEMMVNHPTLPRKFPQIAEAFEAYGRIRGAATAGMAPVGIGLMRVIPIEQALDGNSHKASWEEISKHIEENTLFSVSNCSCRTSREIMGEGCGHLKEEMCIQLGWGAEYYIRTGRGRQVSKEEVYEILKKAEENGLMHEMPNLDGDGKTHAICNCCGCGCFSMRTGGMFKNVDMIRSNYVSVIDSEQCVACGQCVENCPMNAMKLGQKLCSKTKITQDITTKYTPRDHVWTGKDWNPDYRVNREDVVDTGTAPCKTNCPAHIAVQGYIKLAAQGKYREALELIRKENPFPAVCGRICNRRCEDACTRGNVDDPIAIDEIKKFIADQELDEKNRIVPQKRHDYSDKKIAIIGAGPSGLSCAYFLALDGYSVTVFEKENKLGGMLTLGIPSFRLENEIVDAEIAILRKLGVKFKTGVEVGKDTTISKLRKQGYKAFYLAIGAAGGRKLGLDNEDCDGVFSGIEFMRQVNLDDEPVKLKGNTIVVGGGNVAVDVARTAVRCGAAQVSMYSLETFDELPASRDEVDEALSEDILINGGWGPKELIVENGSLKGVRFHRCVRLFDAEQRFNPEYDDNDTVEVPCDNLIVSIGQSIVWSDLLVDEAVVQNKNGTVAVDTLTFQTAVPDIFAGGDVVTGPKFAIDAIAAGKQAAISIHRSVQPGQDLRFGRSRRNFIELDKENAIIEGFDRTPRQFPAHKQDSLRSFKDNRGTFTEEEMMKETLRCLGCGATVVDEYMCVGCGQCTTKCKFDAVKLVKRYDGQGVALENMKKVLVPHVIKRKAKIKIRSLKDKFSKNPDA